MAKRSSYYRPAFDIFAPLYDLGIWLIGLLLGGEKRLRTFIIEETNPVQGCKVLEICCGTATTVLLSAEKGALAYGLDISHGMLNVAREKAQRQKVKLELVQADTISIPFKEKVFDRVVASMGLHEMPFDVTMNVLKEVKQVLKSGGRLIIFDYHQGEGLAGLLQKIFFMFSEHDEAKEFIRADLQKELREAGFKSFNRRLLAKGALQIVTAEA
ncbi:MAG: class I SAM-dependent methyltransferase [Deltaproteobacteria bacterium]|nr:class I SAM-dependent methyltransferase [Deltaproteobacteria bacterium]